MYSDQLRKWRRNTRSLEKKTHHMSQREAARLLGIARSTYKKYESRHNYEPLPKYIGLACSAITFGMKTFMTEQQHDLPG